MLKFMYSEKAKKFCEIFTLLLPYEVPVKSKAKILQNFLAFSEYMNFKRKLYLLEVDLIVNQGIQTSSRNTFKINETICVDSTIWNFAQSFPLEA